jgi:predicted GNAT family acetyltransferase
MPDPEAMHADEWHLTEDIEEFLSQAGDFLRSRPVLHTVPLTAVEALRARGADGYGAEPPLFGWLGRAGEVHAIFLRTPPRRLNLTPVTAEHADALAARLASLGRPLPGASADRDTATAFAGAWQRYTGTTPILRDRMRLYRLGTLTPPEPFPEGQGRIAGKRDREQIMLWCREFAAAVGGTPPVDGDPRFARKRFIFWETPDGTPVSMAGLTPVVAGQTRVDPVYTPAHRRGRGYAGSVTVEASRAALAAGATEVVLFTDLANTTSNALYQRIGYLPVCDFAKYDFSCAAPEAS